MRKLISILCAILFIALLTSPLEKSTVEVVDTSPVVEVVEVSEPVVTPSPWTDEELVVLAKMLWGEARGVKSVTEQAACVWCALNRVDMGYGPIITVVTAPVNS